MVQTAIPVTNLARQYERLKPEIDAAVERVLSGCQYILGEEVERFEQQFAGLHGTAHAVGMNSGTSALHLALLCAGVGPGTEVITVPFTFAGTVAAIEYTGAKPVFVDIDPVSYTMDPGRLASAITPRTRAVLPVHLYGHMAEMDEINAVALKHGVTVVEDAAQAHLASYKSRYPGALGNMACFSFYPTKNLGACGEGGAVLTDDPALAKKLRLLRNWGNEQRYYHLVKAFNYRMEALQGAILSVKLPYLNEWTEMRRSHAAYYGGHLHLPPSALPSEAPGVRHVYHLYTVRSRRRDDMQRQLAAQGIPTAVHYPYPLHLLPAWQDLGYRSGDFPEAERAAREVLSLPLYPELTAGEAAEVCAAVNSLPEEIRVPTES